MQKDDLIRIRHMLDAANEATTFASDKTRMDLEENRMLTLSIIKAIEMIGEFEKIVQARKLVIVGKKSRSSEIIDFFDFSMQLTSLKIS